MTTTSPALWRATFKEFQRQTLRYFQRNVFDIASGGWVDVGVAMTSGDGDLDDWSDLWPSHQWHIAFEILLCQIPTEIADLLPIHDDLLLFVYLPDIAKSKESSVFARRRKKGNALPDDLSTTTTSTTTTSKASEIDWKASLLLNIVLQTEYTLTVMRCPPQEVERILGGGQHGSAPGLSLAAVHSTPGPPATVVRITKVVHASPTRTPVNIDESKATDTTPTPCYPSLCFAVDGFVDAFESLTLTDPSDCYCVLLHAHVENSWHRAVLPTPLPTDIHSAMHALALNKGDSAVATHETTRGGVLVFNGYVSCRTIWNTLKPHVENRTQSPLRGLLLSTSTGGTGSNNALHTTKMSMKGPGGVGRADVAVSVVAARGGTTGDGNEDGYELSINSGSGGKTPLHFAGSVMRGVLQSLRSGGGGGGGLEQGLVTLTCALMSLEVPVDALAEEILKGIVAE